MTHVTSVQPTTPRPVGLRALGLEKPLGSTNSNHLELYSYVFFVFLFFQHPLKTYNKHIFFYLETPSIYG